MDPGKYVDKMSEAYIQYFGIRPVQKYRSPLQKDDNPKLDSTTFLNEKRKEIYHSLIGYGQWNISTGRFDTQSACMLMPKYCTAPRKEHLERVQRTYGYL